jgi:hypothetical protein
MQIKNARTEINLDSSEKYSFHCIYVHGTRSSSMQLHADCL